MTLHEKEHRVLALFLAIRQRGTAELSMEWGTDDSVYLTITRFLNQKIVGNMRVYTADRTQEMDSLIHYLEVLADSEREAVA